MYGTLLPGDVALVNRAAAWNGAERNDIVVFRDPRQDDRPMHERRLLVKRIIGNPRFFDHRYSMGQLGSPIKSF